MRDLWQRLEVLMQAHCPSRYAGLPGPASPAEIGDAENVMGVRLPDELRDFLAIHNGTGDAGICGLIETYSLCSTQEIAQHWQFWRDLADSDPELEIEDHPFVKRMAWDPKWIPFASNGESHFCIDLDPAPGGTVGQVFYHHYEVGPQQVYARSLGAFLEHFVDFWAKGVFQVDPKYGYVGTGENSIRPLMCQI